MRRSQPVRSIVVMGVSGSGKTTVALALSERLQAGFCDGDGLHSEVNVALMAAGYPLGDEERGPWLESVGRTLREARDEGRDLVVACSALRRGYRDILRRFVPDAFFVFLEGPIELVQERIARRSHEFMPPSLLASQYATLEPLEADENGTRVDIRLSPDELVEFIAGRARERQSRTSVAHGRDA